MIDWSARALAVVRSNSTEPLPKLTERNHTDPEKGVSSVLAVPLERETPKSTPTEAPSPEDLSVSSVGSEKVCRNHGPFTALADRVEAREERAAIMEFDGGASRRAAEAQAEKLFGILARCEAWSPSDLDDDRVRCVDCKHLRYGKCFDFRKAGLTSNDVGHDLAIIPQRCAAFVHGPSLYRAPVEKVSRAPANHLRKGWEAFARSREWIRPYLGTLNANGWTDDHLMRLPTNPAGTDAGVVWTLSVFTLADLEIAADCSVAVTREGNRMVLLSSEFQLESTNERTEK